MKYLHHNISSPIVYVCYQDIDVETPQGMVYRGKRMATQRYCGVSVLRAGETMEPALCEVCKDIRLGKILIQTNNDTGEPEVSDKLTIYNDFIGLVHVLFLDL